MSLFAARPARADDDDDDAPRDSGRRGRRYIIRGGSVMSMDPKVGDFAKADVLVEGRKILAVGPNLHAGGADEIDARGRIVMPGFIDTHHHQFETALRSFLANGVLINDQSGLASANPSYFEFILLTFAPCTIRRTCTSASCSADCHSSTTGAQRCTPSPSSIIRPLIPMPPPKRSWLPDAPPPSGLST